MQKAVLYSHPVIKASFNSVPRDWQGSSEEPEPCAICAFPSPIAGEAFLFCAERGGIEQMRGGIPKAYLMDGETMQRVLTRMAHQIMEQEDVGDLLMVGIRSRGVPLAHRLANVIEKVEGVHVPVGELDITMYRDDMSRIGEHPEVSGTVLPETMTGRTVILVDDVLYTGRTVRAAMEAIMDRGRASRIRLAVLIDRGHRELPIRPDFVGKNVPTAKTERVGVQVEEIDGGDGVALYDR